MISEDHEIDLYPTGLYASFVGRINEEIEKIKTIASLDPIC
jgi:hypothetical protein